MIIKQALIFYTVYSTVVSISTSTETPSSLVVSFHSHGEDLILEYFSIGVRTPELLLEDQLAGGRKRHQKLVITIRGLTNDNS